MTILALLLAANFDDVGDDEAFKPKFAKARLEIDGVQLGLVAIRDPYVRHFLTGGRRGS